MILIFWLVVFSLFLHGIIAGTSVDVALVKLPTRKRVGPLAYANFARNNDLGNGIVVYPLLGISALVLTFGTTLITFFQGLELSVMFPLYMACVFTIAHSLSTAKAAPIMLGLRNTKDEEITLKEKLDQFTFWHSLRTIFQVLTFICWLWAFISVDDFMYSKNVSIKEVIMKDTKNVTLNKVTNAKATTTVQKYEPTVYDNSKKGSTLSRIHLEENFNGDISGVGIGEVLQATNSVDQSSNFVAIERIKGKIGEKEGSFLLQVSGTVEMKKMKAHWFIIPGSGTYQLTGIRGEGGFCANLGESGEVYLNYWFE